MSTTVGQQLRQAREARSLSLEQAAQATRMRVHYLQALEAGEFNALPSMTQARGFLRTYAGYLKLDAESLLAQMENRPPAPVEAEGRAASLVEPAPAASSERPTVPVVAPAVEPADMIFIEIGQRLKRQRELLGLSLDDIERHTHLRRHYLSALESGNLQELPSPVQGRGMLNNYAIFLGMDPEPLLLRFADGLQARLAVRQTARAEAKPEPAQDKVKPPARVRRLFSGDVLIGGVLAVFLALFVLWGAIRIFSARSEQQVSPTAPSIADVLLASSTPTSTPQPPPASQTPAPGPGGVLVTPGAPATGAPGGLQPPQAEAGKVQIYIIARQRAWMQALVDGEVEFDGRVIPGQPYTFVGDEQVEILTGNGAALQVYYDQIDLGLMGGFGEVVGRVFSLQGVLTPTPTITPTPTLTLPAPATLPAEAGQPTVPVIP
jgi:cytoskeletal protein RodZ